MVPLLLGILAMFVLLVAMVRLLEPRAAFFPLGGENVTPRDLGVEHEALTIPTSDGERLHGWALDGARRRARVLYFHGNGGNLSLWTPILTAIAAHGYAVLTVDYRGYGLSTGHPTERGLYRDVAAMVERFWRDTSPRVPVVYWGRSLGVTMASYAATIRTPDGLILESGFPDARSLLRRSPLLWLLAHLSRYRLSATDFLNRLESPVPTLVLHGDDDRVVPIAMGQALFRAIGEPKQFVTLRGGDHNDLTPSEPDTYWGAVAGFVASLAPSSRESS